MSEQLPLPCEVNVNHDSPDLRLIGLSTLGYLVKTIANDLPLNMTGQHLFTLGRLIETEAVEVLNAFKATGWKPTQERGAPDKKVAAA